MKCTVHTGLFEQNGRRYMKIHVKDPKLFYKGPQRYVKHFVNPLDGDVLTVKIPFRYNRVMCSVAGDLTLQELQPGDVVDIEVTFCGHWLVGGYGGPTWKADQVTTYKASGKQADKSHHEC